MPKVSPEFIKEVHDASRVVVSHEQLNQAFDRLAAEMKRDLKDTNPIAVCVMNGGLFTTSEVLKRLKFPLQVDYVHASRYANEYTGGKTLNWVKTPNIDPNGRTVVLLDDILDGGLTLAEVARYYSDRGAERVLTAVMLDKDAPREPNGLLRADYTGVKVPNDWLYGFGLDYHGYLRNVPAIHAVDPKHMI